MYVLDDDLKQQFAWATKLAWPQCLNLRKYGKINIANWASNVSKLNWPYFVYAGNFDYHYSKNYIPPKIEKKLVAISTNQHANQLFRQKMFNHDIKTVMGLGYYLRSFWSGSRSNIHFKDKWRQVNQIRFVRICQAFQLI